MIQTDMQQRTLRVLEFTKIREDMAALALTPMGAELCRALEPSHDLTEAQLWQRETEEATVIIQYVGGNPLVSFEDVRPSLSLSEKGAVLPPRALLQVAGMLRASRAARDALCHRDREQHAPAEGQGVRADRPAGEHGARHHRRHHHRGRDHRPRQLRPGGHPPPSAAGANDRIKES